MSQERVLIKFIKSIIMGVVMILVMGGCMGVGSSMFRYHRLCDGESWGRDFVILVERKLWINWEREIRESVEVVGKFGGRFEVRVGDVDRVMYLGWAYWRKLELKNVGVIFVFDHVDSGAEALQLGYSKNELGENYIGIDSVRIWMLGRRVVRNVFIHEIMHALGADHEEDEGSLLNRSVGFDNWCFGAGVRESMRRNWCFVGAVRGCGAGGGR